MVGHGSGEMTGDSTPQATEQVHTKGEDNQSARVVILSVNDVYELFPNDDGVGGVAKFATLLARTKASIPSDTKVIITLNGDFLWRSELDRKDKGPMMMDVMHQLGIEYVVMGNHEFDFGAPYLQELLETARFTSLGSNIRSTSDGELLRGLVDTTIIPLDNGLKLGMFGVCTTETGEEPFAGDTVRFEDEIPHARRCVEALKAQGADVIVGLTHLKMKHDKRLARQVPGVALILGGHDHEPRTEFIGNTMIHKSGKDACWLAKIELQLHKTSSRLLGSRTSVDYQWQMVSNRGYPPDQRCLALLQEYTDRVRAEEEAEGKYVSISKSATALDGTRTGCRTDECNVGNLIADALRCVLGADVGLLQARLIKGDKRSAPGASITPKWLEETLPQLKTTLVIELSVKELRKALLHMLRRYPFMSASMPQVSGFQFVYDISDPDNSLISSMRLTSAPEEELDGERRLKVAMPFVPSTDGWDKFFGKYSPLTTGPVLREVVRQYLQEQPEIAYPSKEGRFRVVR
ncbi:hypothetical protein Poli38472_011304 [Pythium oligandrum]|uniref:5'-nucleotidase n=1 Tax=Pythium oligandrum TaxID=41045 RepID=A0A8K1CR22_PYTOL|nr:hypothetical protein Poli38472_011304 [Pythium oligandrum]|eukprot:TMW67684.1 hypothetical protein Poli38472_011304 [Pythium oligandrum]